MNSKTLIVCLILMFFTSSTAYEVEDSMIILHDDDFPTVFDEFPNLFIEFYAPQCGHCKELAPIFSEAAQQVQEENLDLKLAKVDATEQKQVASKYNIKSFPTLIYFSKGKKTGYEGQRTKDDMLNWLRKKIGIPFRQLTQQAYGQLQNTDKLAIVFHGDPQSQQGQLFKKFATKDEKNCKCQVYLVYYYSTQLHKENNTVEIFRPFYIENKKLAYGTINDGLPAWIKDNQKPLILTFNAKTIAYAFNERKTIIILFNSQNSQLATKQFRAAAETYKNKNKDKIAFTQIYADSKHIHELPDYIKVDIKQNPIVIIQDSLKYIMSVKKLEQVTQQKIIQFLNHWTANKLKPYGLIDQIPHQKAQKPKAQQL